jgi:hypothetical protein
VPFCDTPKSKRGGFHTGSIAHSYDWVKDRETNFWRNKATDLAENKRSKQDKWRNKATVWPHATDVETGVSPSVATGERPRNNFLEEQSYRLASYDSCSKHIGWSPLPMGYRPLKGRMKRHGEVNFLEEQSYRSR